MSLTTFAPVSALFLLSSFGCAAAAIDATPNVDSLIGAKVGAKVGAKQIAGFDFSGVVVRDALPPSSACPEIASEELMACTRVGGTARLAADCAQICNLPIAKDGRVAGFDFRGYRNADAVPVGGACPAFISPEEDACESVHGRSYLDEHCSAVCTKPIARSGFAAGFDFGGFSIRPGYDGAICPLYVTKEEEACDDSIGSSTRVDACHMLCSSPLANPPSKPATTAFSLSRGGSGESPLPPAGSDCEPLVATFDVAPATSAAGATLTWNTCRSDNPWIAPFHWSRGTRVLSPAEVTRVQSAVDSLVISHSGSCVSDHPQLTLELRGGATSPARSVQDERNFCALSASFNDFASLTALESTLDDLSSH